MWGDEYSPTLLNISVNWYNYKNVLKSNAVNIHSL